MGLHADNLSPNRIIGLRSGVARITATYNGLTATATININNATLQKIIVTSINDTLPLSLTSQYTARGIYSDGSNHNITDIVTWSSPGVDDVLMSSKGVATPIAIGRDVVMATYNGISGSSDVTVTNATLVSMNITPTALTTHTGVIK